jgi:hypothetical protein
MTQPPAGRAQELAYQRLKLRAQCARQREQLAVELHAIETELAGVDRAILVARRFMTKPALVAAGVALFTVIGPKRLLRWVTKGAFWYSTGSRLFRAFTGRIADGDGSSLLQRLTYAAQRMRRRPTPSS